MKPRAIDAVFDRVVKTFPAVVLTGPRQSGKTTYLRGKFAKTHQYVNLEDPQTVMRAKTDPVTFLSHLSGPVILDEIQRAPDLLVYIKSAIDEQRKPGRWILTGSQNFALMEGISESLAGRAAVLSLLPFSCSERIGAGKTSKTVTQLLSGNTRRRTGVSAPDLSTMVLRGNYPEIASDERVDRQAWCGSYISTYLERDIRNLQQVGDLGQFQLFLNACAVRTGQILDLSALASDVGISFSTAKRWLSLLETGYQVLLVYPFYRNIGKRLVKRPKVYVTDTGLASYVMGFHERGPLVAGPYWGALFETAVVVDMWKRFLHHGEKPSLYYLRTRDGLEIDMVIEGGARLNFIEVKSAALVRREDVRNMVRAKNDLGGAADKLLLISGGNESFALTPDVSVMSWKDALLQ